MSLDHFHLYFGELVKFFLFFFSCSVNFVDLLEGFLVDGFGF